MSDLLDLLIPHTDDFFSGTFYERITDDNKLEPYSFEYNIVSSYNKQYSMIFGNIVNQKAGDCIIETEDIIAFNIGGYCKLQDGRLYVIKGITNNAENVSKQAYRIFRQVAGKKRVLALVQVNNAWGI